MVLHPPPHLHVYTHGVKFSFDIVNNFIFMRYLLNDLNKSNWGCLLVNGVPMRENKRKAMHRN